MDYILSHNWLLYPVVIYTSLVILKWQYVARRLPYMMRCMREMRPNWNPGVFMFLNVWIPIFVFFGAFIAVPFALATEKKAFFRIYPDEEMKDIAREIVSKGNAS